MFLIVCLLLLRLLFVTFCLLPLLFAYCYFWYLLVPCCYIDVSCNCFVHFRYWCLLFFYDYVSYFLLIVNVFDHLFHVVFCISGYLFVYCHCCFLLLCIVVIFCLLLICIFHVILFIRLIILIAVSSYNFLVYCGFFYFLFFPFRYCCHYCGYFIHNKRRVSYFYFRDYKVFTVLEATYITLFI